MFSCSRRPPEPSPHDSEQGALSNTPPGRCQRRAGRPARAGLDARSWAVEARDRRCFPLRSSSFSRERARRANAIARRALSPTRNDRLARSRSRVSVETIGSSRISIALAPIAWDLPRSQDRNRFETSMRRKCCSIVSRKRMSVRRFRNLLRAEHRGEDSAPRERRKKISALIFGVFAHFTTWRLGSSRRSDRDSFASRLPAQAAPAQHAGTAD